jgi:hypothetical protein
MSFSPQNCSGSIACGAAFAAGFLGGARRKPGTAAAPLPTLSLMQMAADFYAGEGFFDCVTGRPAGAGRGAKSSGHSAQNDGIRFREK